MEELDDTIVYEDSIELGYSMPQPNSSFNTEEIQPQPTNEHDNK